MAAVLITHDLALASEYCDRIVVMHAGHGVESAPTHSLFQAPRHPYTAKLIAATPEPHKSFATSPRLRATCPILKAADIPPCRFSGRCDRYEAGISVTRFPSPENPWCWIIRWPAGNRFSGGAESAGGWGPRGRGAEGQNPQLSENSQHRATPSLKAPKQPSSSTLPSSPSPSSQAPHTPKPPAPHPPMTHSPNPPLPPPSSRSKT
jgi:oligopeptide/dipeptide ABC transporter ATP-binding protein